jgi:di/tricarboxylate transporter
MVAAVLLIGLGFISAKEAVSYIDWPLLLLIGSALGISRAMDESGLAGAQALYM